MDSRRRGAIFLGGLVVLAASWRAATDDPAVVAVSAEVEHTCALLDDGMVRCWGNNEAGPLGTGTPGGPSSPVMVDGIAGATTLSPGLVHTCALPTDHAVRRWGANEPGESGDGTTVLARAPRAAVRFLQ